MPPSDIAAAMPESEPFCLDPFPTKSARSPQAMSQSGSSPLPAPASPSHHASIPNASRIEPTITTPSIRTRSQGMEREGINGPEARLR